MPKIDIRIDTPDLQVTFKELKTGEAFWCGDGYLNIKSKDGRRAVVLNDGTIWEPGTNERVRPANVAMIGV